MSLVEINYHVAQFILFAYESPHLEFYVTKVACGLAGYSSEQIGPMFHSVSYLNNVKLPIEFIDEIDDISISNDSVAIFDDLMSWAPFFYGIYKQFVVIAAILC